MNDIMGEYIDDFVLGFLDDILVFSTTEHAHEHHLRLVCQKLREHKLQAKVKKYLGHIVGSREVHVDQDKVAAVAF